jgi:hypothetical protein
MLMAEGRFISSGQTPMDTQRKRFLTSMELHRAGVQTAASEFFISKTISPIEIPPTTQVQSIGSVG